MMNLSNQIAIVTSAAHGIGAATAMMLARAGANVLICYRKEKRAAEYVMHEIEKMGKRATIVQCRVELMEEC